MTWMLATLLGCWGHLSHNLHWSLCSLGDPLACVPPGSPLPVVGLLLGSTEPSPSLSESTVTLSSPLPSSNFTSQDSMSWCHSQFQSRYALFSSAKPTCTHSIVHSLSLVWSTFGTGV